MAASDFLGQGSYLPAGRYCIGGSPCSRRGALFVVTAQAMKLSGHKTEAVYRRYAIADSVALEEGVAKLAKLHGSDRRERKVVPMNG